MTDIYLIKTDVNGNSGCFEMNAATVVSVPPVQVNTESFRVSSGMADASPALQTGGGGTVINLCLPTGAGEIMPDNNFSVFPNPATHELVVRSSEFGNKSELTIYNLPGEKVFQSHITPGASGLTSQISVDVSQLPSGIYFVKVTNGEKISTRKLIIRD